MKVGIIIPCSDVEDKISVNQFADFINTESGYHLCFVNFGSKDNTLSLLHELENEVGDLVSILDVKRNKGLVSAIKAGVRFLFNKSEIDSIGYFNEELPNSFDDFKKVILSVSTKEASLIHGFRRNINGQSERDLLRSISV